MSIFRSRANRHYFGDPRLDGPAKLSTVIGDDS